MNKSSIVNTIRDQYINQYLESSKRITYTDLTEANGLKTVLYEDLQTTEMHGYPAASDMVGPDGKGYSMDEFIALPEAVKKQCKLRYYYLPKFHELYVGTTGSGKTTGCVEPQLRAISTQKNKPNLFITDPKGELFDRNAKHLQAMGYKLFILNFKDLTRTDNWNPLLEIYELKMKTAEIGNGAKMHTGKVAEGLKYAAPKDSFGDTYIEYDGYAFPDGDLFDRAVKKQIDDIEIKIDGLINSLVCTFISNVSAKDPSWEYGAKDLLNGVLHCMLEDAANPSSGFKQEMMHIRTMHEYYLALKTPIQSDDTNLFRHELIKNKSTKSVAPLCTALNNAPNTMKSYTGVFDGAMKDWIQGHILALTTKNTIDLDNLDSPFALFLITRDYDKSDNIVAGLAIDYVYRKMLERYEGGKEKRALHFLLDEFGNIPPIKDFENKISTARSRNIWFHLFLQSYNQLSNVYGQSTAGIVLDNCNVQVFLGSQNTESKQIFSQACGKQVVPSLASKLNPSDNSIIEAPVVPMSDLDLIRPGQLYVKRLMTPVFLSQFIRSYTCEDYGIFKKERDGLVDCTPFSWETYTDEKFTYQKLQKFFGAKKKSSSDFF